MNSHLLNQSLINFKLSHPLQPKVEYFCNKIFKNRVKFFTKYENFTLLGRDQEYTLNKSDLKILHSHYKNKKCLRFEKILCDGIRYTCESYDRAEKTYDHFFPTKINNFGLIQSILLFSNEKNAEVLIIFKKLDIIGPFLKTDNLIIDHIKECKDPFVNNTNFHFCKVEDIARPCIFMRSEKNATFQIFLKV